MRQHDVTVYGATGFTGGLVADYLAAKEGLSVDRWALAGRNLDKLRGVRARLAKQNPALSELAIYQAEASDPQSLADVAVRTRVLLTTVGPYEQHGPPVVAACVEAGTDYVDLTGEPPFWREMIAQHDSAARERNVLLVPCCGFDSIPHDVGAWLVADALREHAQKTGQPITANGYVAAKGKPSGGTWNSLLGILSDTPLRPKSGGGGGGGGRSPGAHFASDVARWVVPMPTIDPMVVRRSATLAAYGDGFGYRAWFETKSRWHMVPLAAGMGALTLAAKIPPVRSLLGSLHPSGAGPSEATRNESWFRVKVVANCGEATATATVSGGDPGYTETAKMIAESALCLATERESLPLQGGLATPAAAMGRHLVQRLRDAGLGITVAVIPAPPA